MSPSRSLGLVIVLGLLLVGCGKHYWGKPGASADDFTRDSNECARSNAMYMSANKDYGIVHAELYRACLQSRGWTRTQHHDPPLGWFRGIESDEPVKFDQPPPQPPPAPR
jgi:hypothetical protein